MPGLIPEFTLADIFRRIDKFAKERERKAFEILSYIGIEAVKFAKKYHGYQDRTGNLTSSIGYAIINNGKIESTYGGGDATVQQGLTGKTKKIKSTSEGRQGAVKIVEQLAAEYPRGLILVVIAGMEYAAAVESKGYDVITGSSLYADAELLPFIREKLGVEFG